ncbi:peptide chain release factor-like protein [bacterium]|nr:peptide chain release factor-like protein [Candidatus Elulimicrobium humile]
MKQANKPEPLFSVTRTDCEWSYTRGTGAGGQKRNKTSSAVHCHHRPSGAHGYSEASRSQLENRQDAFRKMAESTQFQVWARKEMMKRTGEALEIERWLERELTKIKIEIKIDGRWREVRQHMLVDDPEDFRIEWLAEME